MRFFLLEGCSNIMLCGKEYRVIKFMADLSLTVLPQSEMIWEHKAGEVAKAENITANWTTGENGRFMIVYTFMSFSQSHSNSSKVKHTQLSLKDYNHHSSKKRFDGYLCLSTRKDNGIR